MTSDWLVYLFYSYIWKTSPFIPTFSNMFWIGLKTPILWLYVPIINQLAFFSFLDSQWKQGAICSDMLM
jgi:hypothetical protein